MSISTADGQKLETSVSQSIGRTVITDNVYCKQAVKASRHILVVEPTSDAELLLVALVISYDERKSYTSSVEFTSFNFANPSMRSISSLLKPLRLLLYYKKTHQEKEINPATVTIVWMVWRSVRLQSQILPKSRNPLLKICVFRCF